jgi:hypothetical protein
MDHEFYVPVDKPTERMTHFKLSVFFRRGGVNCYDGKPYPGGVYVSVGTVVLKDGMESFVMYSDNARMIEPATRWDCNRVQTVFYKVKADFEAKTGIAWEIATTVLKAQPATA